MVFRKITFFIICIIFLAIQDGWSKNYKVIGNVGNSEKLFDTIIHKKNFAVFQKGGSGQNYFIVFLNKAQYIKNISFWMKEEYKIEIEISQNLFSWSKVDVQSQITKNNGLYKCEINLDNRVGSFIKIIFPEPKSKFYLYEMIIKNNPTLSIQKTSVTPLNVGKHHVQLQIDSDIATIAQIQYGLSITKLKDGPLLSDFSKHHIFDIKNLLKGTKYYFVGIVKDGNGGMKYTKPISIKTKGIPLPLINNSHKITHKYNDVEIQFDSNVPTTYTVYAGVSLDLKFKQKFNQFSTHHSFHLLNFPPSSKIYYKISIQDKFGNTKTTPVKEFLSLPYNAGSEAVLSGDFNYIGENLGPIYQKGSIRRLVDGQVSYKGAVMSGAINQDQILKVDFKKNISLKYIDLIWWKLIYSTDFMVYYSLDKKKWINLPTFTQVKFEYPYKINTSYLVHRVRCEKKLRYLKFVFKKNKVFRQFPQYNNLRLLEIFFIPEKKNIQKVDILIKK